MPTNDERREVAARLRQYIDFDFEDSNPYWYVMKAIYGDVAIHGDNELFARIADLIEPEPERTCEYIGDKISGGCSVCRGWLDPACAYCPSCGAKVVE